MPPPGDSPYFARVERFILASPEHIFDLLADPSRHHEIDGSGTVVASKEPSQRLALGSKFGMSMKLFLRYSMVSTVVEFDENRSIAWQPWPSWALLRLFIGGRIWRYELIPQDGGTLVRESWDIRKEKTRLVARRMKSHTIDNMTQTLERIERLLSQR